MPLTLGLLILIVFFTRALSALLEVIAKPQGIEHWPRDTCQTLALVPPWLIAV